MEQVGEEKSFLGYCFIVLDLLVQIKEKYYFNYLFSLSASTGKRILSSPERRTHSEMSISLPCQAHPQRKQIRQKLIATFCPHIDHNSVWISDLN